MQKNINNGGIASSPSSVNSLASLSGSNSLNGNGTTNRALRKLESRAYPASKMDTVISKVQFHARQNSRAVAALVGFVFVVLIVTSDAIQDSAAAILSLGGGGGSGSQQLRGSAKVDAMAHWGGAIRPGSFKVEDAIVTPTDVNSNTHIFRFSAVTDLDQLSAVADSKKPTFRSLFLPGILKRTGTKDYEITFEHPRTLTTKHNEAGRGAEFSELTIYNDRLLTFDDRTGDVFEIINNKDGTSSEVVPRFIITEGEGDTDKGMKWEWATVKDGDLYMGSMGKEYTAPDGTVLNENNLWVGILNARGELRRENWKAKYSVVRKALGAENPGYVIMEAILWSQHMKKWVFLPRRISSTEYDDVQDERRGGNKLVLVDEKFTKTEVVVISMESDPLRGFSTFAFVPGTNDRHAIAIRSVEENCAGDDLDACEQRSYFLVFDVKTGEVLSQEKKYKEKMKFEGIEFANMYTVPKY
jgi:soluble calcium-activated nucleotidase 1